MMSLRFFSLVPIVLMSCVVASAQTLEETKAQTAEKSDRPNIVLVLADDMGYSDLGCYGGEIETPHLDQLAKAGSRWTQFYNTARCWPTRSSLLTGYYAQQVSRDAIPGIPGRGQGTRPKWGTLVAQHLQTAGYRCYHSGKWHIDGKATENGFHRSYITKGHNRYFYPKSHFEDDARLEPVKKDSGYYSTDFITDHALKCLKEHQVDHSDKPFFSFVAFLAPHFPLHAPQESIDEYRGRYDQGWNQIRRDRLTRINQTLKLNTKLSQLEPKIGPPYHFPDALKILGNGEVNRELNWDDLNLTQQTFQAKKMEIHAAMISRMDENIGRLVSHLRTTNQLKNTLILFLSDNGASAEIMVRGDGHDPKAVPGSAASYLCLGPGWSSCANTPFRRHKTWVHEGGISTPMIAHWPKKIPAGTLRHQVAHVVDVTPTLLEIAGIDEKTTVPAGSPARPGVSLTNALLNDSAIHHDFLWWLHEGNRAIRENNWKLVAAKDESWELYDLATDRSETKNLADDQPDIVKRLSRKWERQLEQTRNLFSK